MHPNPFVILEAVVGFGILIFVHELGHFLAAKWIGVRVDVFSLGFGPSLKKKWGETEYRLGICPLGGYIKMAGEEPAPDKPPQPGEFYSKTVGQRAIVFSAGVFMNFVFGFLVFILAFQFGVPTVPATVGSVRPGSPAWNVGLKRGDQIERIDNVSPPIDFEDLSTAVMLSGPGQGIPLTVRRGERTFETVIHPAYDKELGMPSAGIHQPETMAIAEAPKSRGADEADFTKIFEAGMKPGDVITAVQVAGRKEPMPVATADEFRFAMSDCAGEPVRIFYRRGESSAEQSITVTPQLAGPARWLGIEFGSNHVSAVRPGSWADKAGLLPGDVIVAVSDKPVRSRGDVTRALEPKYGMADDSLTVRRDGKDVSLRLTVAAPANETVEECIAFDPESLVVNRTERGYPAERIGMQPGDEILSANGIEVRNVPQLAEIQDKSKGGALTLVWRRDGKPMTASVTLQQNWVIGLMLEQGPQTVVRAGLWKSCFLGTRKAFQWVLRTYAALRSLLFREVSARHLSGPLSIGYLAYAAAKRGLGMFLYILGVLSINLGVMNLLPVPVLDGGHLLFAAIEKVRGRPVNERIRSIATYIGLGLILGLLLLAFWNDIYGWIRG